jgi:hypothetical protein
MSQPDSHQAIEEHLVKLASDNAVLQEIAREWFRSQGMNAINELEMALNNPGLGAVAHWRIMRLLAELNPTGSTPAVIHALDRGLETQNHTLITGAIEALRAINNDSAIQRLIELLGHPNTDIVKQAAIALGALHPEQALDSLLRMLSTADESVRYTVVGALLQYENPSVKDRLHEHKKRETDEEIRQLMKTSGSL